MSHEESLYNITGNPIFGKISKPGYQSKFVRYHPFIPEHTPQRIAQFNKEPIVTGKVMFLGNSITEMGDWKKVLHDSTVINRGIAGDVTYGILKRLKDVTTGSRQKFSYL